MKLKHLPDCPIQYPRMILAFVAALILMSPARSGEPTPLSSSYQSRDGHPADHLPPYIRQVSGFGERPEWSHDAKKILFVAKPMGEVYELELETGLTRPMTRHFKHHGFTRANYLANGDILLVGPNEPFDRTDHQQRLKARHYCWLYVMDGEGESEPVALGTMAAEGPAVSRTRMQIAWTQRDQQDPSLGQNHARHFVANIVYKDGTPQLADRRVVFDSHQLPFDLGGASLETQDFVPPDDRRLIFSTYVIEGGNNTDTFVVDTETGEFQNLTRSPDYYDEPEGVFPDGLHTCVEHAPSHHQAWPLCDLFKLELDGSGRMQRLTHFSNFKGYKAAQGVVSDDGKKLCFQIGKAGDEAGVGYGFFVMDLETAAEHLEPFQGFATDALPAESLFQQFAGAWDAGRPLPAISQLEPKFSLEQAYALQRAWVRETLDEEGIGGVKGGLVTEGGQKWLGVDQPIGAILRASGRRDANEDPTLSLASMNNLKLETELGFVVGQAIDRPLETVDQFRAHVRSVIPAIELLAGRWDKPNGKPNVADLAAINVRASGYILGDPVDPNEVNLRTVAIGLTLNGQQLHKASGADCWNGPWETGLWLANFAHQQGIELQPGQIILCGALGKVQSAAVGRYEMTAGPLGTIRFSVVE